MTNQHKVPKCRIRGICTVPYILAHIYYNPIRNSKNRRAYWVGKV